MSTWTIEYDSLEQSLEQLGVADATLNFTAQAKSTLSIRLPGVPSLISAPPIPYGGAIKLRRNRTLAAGVYSGGEIVFQGTQVTRRGSAQPGSPADTLIFSDAWFELENLVF